jgi:hypothetical protein
MLAQSRQIAFGWLAAGFEVDSQNVERIEQAGHHVRGAAESADQLRAFLIGKAHEPLLCVVRTALRAGMPAPVDPIVAGITLRYQRPIA